MKKIYLYILSIFLVVILLILFLIRYVIFDNDDLKGESIIDNNISIIGDYLFYAEEGNIVTKARNLRTDEEKIVGIGLCNISVYDDEIYYLAQRSVNPESFFCKRDIHSFIEKRVMSGKVSSYKIYNGFLYYQKNSYTTNADGRENGYIYRMNVDTNQAEELISVRTRGFTIVGDILYYSKHLDEGYKQYGELLCDGIWSYSLLDKTQSLVIDAMIRDFDIHDNNIVYSEYSLDKSNDREGKYHLLWLNLDTDKTIEISEDVVTFRLYNEKICYIEGAMPDVINIFNYANGTIMPVVVKNIDYIYGFVMYEDKVYYYDKNHNLCIANI